MATREITGNVFDLTDSAVASGVVTFEKIVTSTTGTTIHQSGVTTDTTDANGDFSIDLAVPASGSYRYRMILPNGASFYFSIAAGSSVNVATLIVAETIEDSDAVVEALAAYLALAGGTMTGQLNFSGTAHAGIKLLSLTTAQRDALTPANGMVIYNTTTATGQVYQGGAWADVGGGAVDSVFARTGAVVAASGDYAASQITDDSGEGQENVRDALNSLRGSANDAYNYIDTHQAATTNVHGITDTSALLTTSAIGSTVQAYSAKTAAIAALTWAANSILLLTGTATASVQALAAHVVTFLQSASAADARTAIGAGDVTAGAVIADNAVVRGDGGAKGVQSSGVTIGDTDIVTVPTGGQVVLPVANTPSTPALMFGSGDGIYSRTATVVNVAGGGVIYFEFHPTVHTTSKNINGSNASSFALSITPGTITNPTIIPNRSDDNTGLGWAAADKPVLIGGGVPLLLGARLTGIVGSAQSVIANATGDVTLVLSGTFTVSDGAGNVAGGVITATAPGASFNLYDDGGTNTCQLQVAADGSVTVIRTAGSRTYAVNLHLNWM